MNVIYAKQKFPSFQDEKIIFLVGPTPRSKSVASWRPDALSILDEKGFDGLVLVPEPEGEWHGDYIDQIKWEQEGLKACSQSGCIAAWVPRDLETMPAFTTNVEFGLYVETGRFLYGRPSESPKNRYLDWIYNDRTGNTPCVSLEDLMILSIELVGEIDGS